MKINVPCVILCGGKSSRMGEDKSMLPFGGYATLAEYQYKRLSEIFNDVYISCKNSSKYGFNGDFIEDEGEEFNPFLGIKSSFNAIASPQIFFITVDAPFVGKGVIDTIFEAFDPSFEVVIPKDSKGTHNLIGVYSSSLVPKILKMESDGIFKVGALIKESRFKIVEFGDSKTFINLNYKEEYLQVIERVKVGFYLIIVNAIIKSIILWILLLWAFNKFLTKPIVSFATKVQNINLDNIEESEFLKNQAVSNLENSDEIEVFKNRFSIMLQKIYSSKIELINAENAKREQEKIILLQYKKAALGDLISIIAHQLKQPLSSISLCMGGIEDIFEQNELTQEAFDTYSKTITNQIDFMSSSIDDLKNFFNPDRMPKSFSVKKAIQNALLIINVQLNKSGISMEIDLEYDKEILGFKNDLEQVILNIIANSKDALLEKKPTNPKIIVKTTKDEDKIVITIEDNGGGIPTEMIDKVFNMYFSTKGEKGTGIGLNLAKMIIEQNMQGKIFVSNTLSGACFTIKI